MKRKLAALRKRVQVTHPVDETNQSEGIHLNSPISVAYVRVIINEAYDVIEKQMLESIPGPNNSKFRKIKYAWPVCMRLLQTMKDIMNKKEIANTSLGN